MEVLVRFDGDVAPLVAALRAMVRRLDPGLPVTRIATVESLASESLSRPRFYTTLFGGFAVVALILALVGVYGTTSFATRTRVREIGIRLALGARRRRVVGRTVARTGGVIAAGVGLGLAAAFVGARGMVDVLVYVTPRDWAAYLSVAVLVMSAGILAAWVPAGRAGRVDPANALREE
jgi:ABC-type antimicrobial peptide transport system permease subunit